MPLLARVLGWTKEETEGLMDRAKLDLSNVEWAGLPWLTSCTNPGRTFGILEISYTLISTSFTAESLRIISIESAALEV